MTICTDCEKRPYCSSLCPEAKAYAKQDWVKLKELPIGLPKYTKANTVDVEELAEKEEVNRFLDDLEGKTLEQKVATLLEAGLDRKEIAQLLDITRERLRDTIRKLKQKATL